MNRVLGIDFAVLLPRSKRPDRKSFARNAKISSGILAMCSPLTYSDRYFQRPAVRRSNVQSPGAFGARRGFLVSLHKIKGRKSLLVIDDAG